MPEFGNILDQLDTWIKFAIAIFIAYSKTLIKRFKDDTDRLYQKSRDLKIENEALRIKLEKHLSFHEGQNEKENIS